MRTSVPSGRVVPRAVAAGLAVAAIATLAMAACSSAPKAPYADHRSMGAIALYGKDGKPVTGGKVADKPFVWKAVSLAKAPADYAVTGRKATLVAIQPRQSLDSEQWDGNFLTAARTYADPDQPTVQATDQDSSLSDFLAGYPPQWNGFVQLRIYLGAPGKPTLNTRYASADLKVDGDKWSLMRGATNAAFSGRAAFSGWDGGRCGV